MTTNPDNIIRSDGTVSIMALLNGASGYTTKDLDLIGYLLSQHNGDDRCGCLNGLFIFDYERGAIEVDGDIAAILMRHNDGHAAGGEL